MPASIPNTIDYVEIPSRDVQKSRAFFEAFVGWKFTDYGPDYVSFEDGRINGGFFTSDKVSSTASGSALAVIFTPDLERFREKTIKLGATITRDTFSFPGGRRFQFAEPGGSEFSIWTDK
jgi:predicted enzyme related to lactoylglutathione lyase